MWQSALLRFVIVRIVMQLTSRTAHAPTSPTSLKKATGDDFGPNDNDLIKLGKETYRGDFPAGFGQKMDGQV